MLEGQLEAFDARAARCYDDSDRAEILTAIERMYSASGGLDAFNAMVRTTLKEQVLAQFTQQRSKLPYVTLLTGLLPGVSFAMGAGVTFFREAPVVSQIVWAIYITTFIWCAMPLVGAWSVDRGADIAVRACADGQALRLSDLLHASVTRNAILLSTARSAFEFVFLHAGVSYFLVLFIANEPERFGLRSVDSVWLALVSNAFWIVSAYLMFRTTPLEEEGEEDNSEPLNPGPNGFLL